MTFQNAKVVKTNCSNQEYLALEAMGRSSLMEFLHCPHRYRMGYRGDEGSEATEHGSLVDTILLMGDRFEDRYAVCPETYEDKNGESKPWTFAATPCKQWKKEHAGKEIVRWGPHDKASQAVEMLLADQQIARLVEQSDHQVLVTADYVDKATGIKIPVKGLIDIVPRLDSEFPKCLFDLKTGADASPREWARACFKRGYHVQAALYLDLYIAATGEERWDFRHIVQENFEPFEPAKYFLSEELVQLGRDHYLAGFRKLAQSIAADNWPGYRTPGQMNIDGYEKIDREEWMLRYALEATGNDAPVLRYETKGAPQEEPIDLMP